MLEILSHEADTQGDRTPLEANSKEEIREINEETNKFVEEAKRSTTINRAESSTRKLGQAELASSRPGFDYLLFDVRCSRLRISHYSRCFKANISTETISNRPMKARHERSHQEGHSSTNNPL